MDESVEACPPSAGYRLSKFVRRNRGAVLAALMSVVLLLGGIAGTTRGLVRADRARKAEADRAEGEKKANAQAQQRLQQIEKASEILASVFSDLDPRAEEKEGKPLRMLLGDRLDRAANKLEGDAVGDPVVVANLQDRLGRSYQASGHAAKAKAMFTKSLAIRRAQLNADHADILTAMSQQASALTNLGKHSDAISLYEQVRDARSRILGANHRDTLTAGHHLAAAYWKAGRGSEAIFLAQQVRDARVKNYGVDHPLSIVALNDLASRYQSNGKMKLALSLYEEARDRLVPRLGSDHPNTLAVLDNLARMYRAFGRKAESVSLAEQVRDGRRMTIGSYHPYTLYTLNNLGHSYLADDKPEKALTMFEQAGAGIEMLNFNDVTAGRIVTDLCNCLVEQGQADRADIWRGKWLAAVKKRDGANSAAHALELAKQGEDILRHGRHASAEPILRECLTILQKTEPGSPTTFLAQSLLGDALLARKNYTEAEPLLIQGYKGLKAREGHMSPLSARFRISEAGARIVRLYEAWGRAENG